MDDGMIIRQIDHILIQSASPSSLFSFLSNELELPVAWPLTSYGSFTSGGVNAGNVNLEVISSSDYNGTKESFHTWFGGLALEPVPLLKCVAELDRRGIKHGQIERPHTTDAAEQPWSSVVLPELSAPGLEIFLCQYERPVDEFRSALRTRLASRQGGSTGIIGVGEVTLGAMNYELARTYWARLLAPVRTTRSDVWAIGDGPAIRLVPSPSSAIQSIVFLVRSLDRTREYLASNGMLEPSSTVVAIAADKAQGLTLRLAQAGP